MQAQEFFIKKDTMTLKEGIEYYLRSLIKNNDELSVFSEKFMKENADGIFQLLVNDLTYFKGLDLWCVEAISKVIPQYENRIINVHKIYTTVYTNSVISLLDSAIKKNDFLLMNEFNLFIMEKSHEVNTQEDRHLAIELKKIIDEKISSIPESLEIYSSFIKLKNYLDSISMVPKLKYITAKALIDKGIFKPDPKEGSGNMPDIKNIDESKQLLSQIIHQSIQNDISDIFKP